MPRRGCPAPGDRRDRHARRRYRRPASRRALPRLAQYRAPRIGPPVRGRRRISADAWPVGLSPRRGCARNVVNSFNAHRLTLLAAFVAAVALPSTAEPQRRQLAQGSAQSFEHDAPMAPGGASDADWKPWTNGRYRITPGDVLDLK